VARGSGLCERSRSRVEALYEHYYYYYYYYLTPAQSFSDSSVLPVLWMMSCFHNGAFTLEQSRVKQFATSLTVGGTHMPECYLPTGRSDDIPSIASEKLVLDLAAPEGCKAELN